MSFFNKSKTKKLMSVILATVLICGFVGCKNIDKIAVGNSFANEEFSNHELPSGNLAEHSFKNVDNPVICETESNNYLDNTTPLPTKGRLKQVLSNKDWDDKVDNLLIELYDRVDMCYDLRELYKAEDKQLYLENLVDTIESVNVIKIDHDDEVLIANGWTARADYVNNEIINKYENIVNFRHELAHMESGTFLNGSNWCDLGFVLEEGRSSYKEGDAMPRIEWVDTYSVDIDPDPMDELIISNCAGSYPAFEEIYKNFIRMGIDLEAIRMQAQSVQVYTEQIEAELNNIYGNNLGSKYVELVNEYIGYFDNKGKVNTGLKSSEEVFRETKQAMETIYMECMMQKNRISLNKGQ